MIKRGHKYISRVISQFFGNRYDAGLEEEIQSWIVNDKFSQEKEDAMLGLWENLSVDADRSTYDALRRTQQQLNMHKKKTSLLFLSRNSVKIAAAILLPLFLFLGGYYVFFNKGVEMTELVASYGEISEETLIDGTEVWINSGSSIRYDKNFKSSERAVSLSGEAYFDVEKHRSKPFVVNTKHLNVRVLGTQLNVRAFPEEERTIITLASGAVKIEVEDGATYELRPNQQLTYNNQTAEVSIEDVVANDFLGWRAGHLLFDDSTFEEILLACERHHNTSVTIDENFSIPDDIYTIRFVNREDINQTMAVLKELIGGFDYDVSIDNVVYIHNQEIATITDNTPVAPAPIVEEAVEEKSTLMSIDSTEISYKGIFEQIEAQAGYSVAFNQSRFDAYRILPETSYTDSDFREILDDILRDTGFTYKVEKNHILILEEEGLQEISGYILDSDTGQPVANASVTTGDNHRKTKTDRNGYFSLEPLKPGDYVIAINASGYNPGSRKIALTEKSGVSLKVHIIELIPTVSTDITVNAVPADSKTYIMQPRGKMDRPHFTVRSNLLYMFGTFTPNLAFEFSLSNRFTADILLGYNPSSSSGNKLQFKHILIQPELRYWPSFAFNKHFWGVHMSYGTYDNMSICKDETIYDGNLIGAGVSYGYNYPINRKWAIEGNIGIGYIRGNHYVERREGNFYLRDDRKIIKNYYGITKLGISIKYTIK